MAIDRQQMIGAVSKALGEHMNGTLVGTCCAQVAVDSLLPLLGDDTAEFHVRKDAPDTSKDVSDKIRSGSLQYLLLNRFRWADHVESGHTDDELEELTGRTHQSVSATRNTLMRKGYVIDSGLRRKTRSGNPAIVYVWTGKVAP